MHTQDHLRSRMIKASTRGDVGCPPRGGLRVEFGDWISLMLWGCGRFQATVTGSIQISSPVFVHPFHISGAGTLMMERWTWGPWRRDALDDSLPTFLIHCT